MTFRLPEQAEKPAYVQAMFDRIATGYDRANDLMTGGRHRAWKRRLVSSLSPKAGDEALDLATGTGDIARLLAEAVGPDGQVTGLDFSANMLDAARLRGECAVAWVQGDMLALPFEASAFDEVSVGFGLRNVADLDQALAEVFRVLKPGGRFASLDMARPRMAPLRPFVSLYSFAVVPLMGRLVTGEGEAYRYLPESNRVFPAQEQLGKRFEAAGFVNVRVIDMMLGAVAIVGGEKPSSR